MKLPDFIVTEAILEFAQKKNPSPLIGLLRDPKTVLTMEDPERLARALEGKYRPKRGAPIRRSATVLMDARIRRDIAKELPKKKLPANFYTARHAALIEHDNVNRAALLLKSALAELRAGGKSYGQHNAVVNAVKAHLAQNGHEIPADWEAVENLVRRGAKPRK